MEIDIYEHIKIERERQQKLVDSGKFLWSCANILISLDRKMTVLSEEVGEVAKEVCDYGISQDKYARENMTFPPHRTEYFLLNIRKELIQVAAVCVAWIEALDQQIKFTK